MKELTHEDWMENTTPRVMWVWDNDNDSIGKMKVIYVSDRDVKYPVIVLADNDLDICRYKHCAEIEKQRRMTNKELSRWLRENPTREYTYKTASNNVVYCYHAYPEIYADDEVADTTLIRENYGEWKEPLIEEE